MYNLSTSTVEFRHYCMGIHCARDKVSLFYPISSAMHMRMLISCSSGVSCTPACVEIETFFCTYSAQYCPNSTVNAELSIFLHSITSATGMVPASLLLKPTVHGASSRKGTSPFRTFRTFNDDGCSP